MKMVNICMLRSLNKKPFFEGKRKEQNPLTLLHKYAFLFNQKVHIHNIAPPNQK